MERYYTRSNEKEECWELLERDAIVDGGTGRSEDALIARFYDGSSMQSPLAEVMKGLLNVASQMTQEGA